MARATIKQVAQLADVSIATVSRYINGTANVNRMTAKRIAEAIRQLDYPLPEPLMPTLETKHRTSRVILYNSFAANNTGVTPTLQGIQDAAAAHGYYVLSSSMNLSVLTENAFFTMLDEVPLAGMILGRVIDDDIFSKLYRTLPFVQVGEINENQKLVSTVSIDDTLAIRRITDYLFSIGRSKMAFLGVSEKYLYGRHRRKGYLDSLNAHKVQPNLDWLLTVPDSDYDSAYSIMREIFLREEHPNAVVAVSDVLAMAAIHACQDICLNVPGDVAVTGFDNSLYSRSTVPSFTTIDQPFYGMGYAACEMLVEKINNPSSQVQQLQMETELIIRGSTTLF